MSNASEGCMIHRPNAYVDLEVFYFGEPDCCSFTFKLTIKLNYNLQINTARLGKTQ